MVVILTMLSHFLAVFACSALWLTQAAAAGNGLSHRHGSTPLLQGKRKKECKEGCF